MPDSQAGYSPATVNQDTETVYPPLGTAPGSPGTVTQAQQASVADTTGTSVAGIGPALPGGSVSDVIPWAGSGQAGGMTGPGLLQWSGYTVKDAGKSGPLGFLPGAPSTSETLGGQPGTAPVTPASPYPWLPTSTLLTGTLDTQIGGGSALTPGLGTPPAYRAPSAIAGSGASNKDTTLTDLLGNMVAAMPLTGASYAAVNIDTSYSGAPASPAQLSTQVDTFTSTAPSPTRYYATQPGIVPASLIVRDVTNANLILTAGSDYTVTTALNGQKTAAYITLTVVATRYTAGDTVSLTYSYGSPQYYDSNLPPAVAQGNVDTLWLSLVPARLTGWGVTTAASALTVFDVTQNQALVYNTDYTVQTIVEPTTPGGTYTESPRTTYAITWRPQSTIAKLGDTITVTYNFSTSVPTAPGLGGSISHTDNIATFSATAFPLTVTGVVTPPASLQLVNNQAGANFGKTLVLNLDYTVTITGSGSTLAYSLTRLAGSTNSTLNDNVRVTYSTGNAAYFTSGPVVPGDKGIFVPFSAPAGTTPVDYYLIQSSDLGTQYVPASGQPGMYGQPSPSDGGAESGQPAYQSDTFTGTFSSSTPVALSKTGIITAPGQLVVRDLTSTQKDPLQPTGTVLIYGYDYTVTQAGTGPWLTYSVQRIASSVNSANGDTITVSYWYNTMGSVPLTYVADAITTAARVGTLHNGDVATPPRNLIVYDTTTSKALAYGLDFTAAALGTGPAQTVQITTIAGGPANAGAADNLTVYYGYGIVLATVFAQGVPANWVPFPTPAGGVKAAGQGVQLSIAAGNRAGLGPFSTWSDYVSPLNYNAPQPGAQGTTTVGTGSLDPRNSINPIYLPNGTVKAGTGLGP
jgi:hypothetical protein